MAVVGRGTDGATRKPTSVLENTGGGFVQGGSGVGG